MCGLYFPIREGAADNSYESKANTMVSFTAVGPPVDGVEVAFTIDDIEIFTESLGFIFNTATLTLTDTQCKI